MSDPCVICRDCIHLLNRLTAGKTEHRAALRELAAHLAADHAEGRVA